MRCLRVYFLSLFYPGLADPNVPLPPGLLIESQVHISRWLNKAEEACSAIVVGINSSHCDCLHVGVEFLVINRYCPICRGRGFGLSIAISGTSRHIPHIVCLYRLPETSFDIVPIGCRSPVSDICRPCALLQPLKHFTSSQPD